MCTFITMGSVSQKIGRSFHSLWLSKFPHQTGNFGACASNPFPPIANINNINIENPWFFQERIWQCRIFIEKNICLHLSCRLLLRETIVSCWIKKPVFDMVFMGFYYLRQGQTGHNLWVHPSDVVTSWCPASYVCWFIHHKVVPPRYLSWCK